jgi:hypothetical protein
LLRKAESFDIKIVTELDEKTAGAMRLNKIKSLSDEFRDQNGYILPAASKLRLVSGV